jgi:hypothetical protein
MLGVTMRRVTMDGSDEGWERRGDLGYLCGWANVRGGRRAITLLRVRDRERDGDAAAARLQWRRSKVGDGYG